MRQAISENEINRQLRLENERLLRELENQQLIFECTLDAIMILDEKMNFMSVNSAACKMFQLREEKLKTRSLKEFLSLFPEDGLKKVENHIKEKKECCSDELLIRLDNGQLKFIEYAVRKNDFSTSFLIIMRDISETKKLERENAINERTLKDLFHQAVDCIVIFDLKGRLIEVNRSFLVNFEVQEEELQELVLADFVKKEHKSELLSLWDRLNEHSKVHGELPIVLKSGKKKIFEYTITSNIFSGLYMAIMRDVTDKRLIERKLYKSEERFREIYENAVDAIMIMDKRGRIIQANNSASRTFEIPLEKLIESKFTDFIAKKDENYERVKMEYRKKGSIRSELLFYMPNGEYKSLEFTAKFDAVEGHHLAILRNVSDRKKMEQDLRKSEEKFRKVFNASMHAIILFDNDYNILDANPIAGEIFNIPYDKISSSNLFEDIIHKREKGSSSLDNFEELDKAAGELVFKLEGREKIIEFCLKRNITENMNLATFRDITERKQLKEQLRKSDTLHVVGELAAGIAHEIRNPMTSLKGFIQLLEASVKEDFSTYFGIITSELNRIESIITEFLVLAKPQVTKFLQKDICEIMKNTIDLLNAQANLLNVRLDLYYDNNLPAIYCEPNQLKQVFINILKNAIEVMPKGGNVTIDIKKKNSEEIIVSIADEGFGIPADKLKRLGEPFYTTKERGTGLGLMVSYKIIEEHFGKIKVESVEGEGTIFHLILPINKHL
ncbi:PAS domain S-box protein [Metabacillus fastidiosus]|uniref:PAS domain S-box protein n=1 Tax=Metabacillus fastidiosus TaxID=1458 RepID=UPI002E20E20C|nr:PAS domain S-box protein [Metabacillus fastidiosus]